jgi:ribonuclease P protein component
MRAVDEGVSKLFPKQHRLLSPSDFKTVFANSKRFDSREFTLFVCSGTTKHSRLGMAISKKNIKHAVDRNQIKRIARESFRHYPWGRQLDIVLIGKRQMKQLNAHELRQRLDNAWPRIEQHF